MKLDNRAPIDAEAHHQHTTICQPARWLFIVIIEIVKLAAIISTRIDSNRRFDYRRLWLRRSIGAHRRRDRFFWWWLRRFLRRFLQRFLRRGRLFCRSLIISLLRAVLVGIIARAGIIDNYFRRRRWI